ncbi:MAG: hypothetical protein JSS02_03730 [Planctomycetes bacterium]|nr:hypothetical protein [Planctomycetota bacterium]
MSFSLKSRAFFGSVLATGLMLASVGCSPEASTPKAGGTTPGAAAPSGEKLGPAKPKEQAGSTTDGEKKGDEVPEPAAKSGS